MDLQPWLSRNPYSLNSKDKNALLFAALQRLTSQHYENCLPYRNILNGMGFNPSNHREISEIPFLPVRLFKELELSSVASDEVIKTMTSSGTTGQQVSKIYLDRDTSLNQTRVLVKIVNDFIGSQRLPMIVIDNPMVIKDPKMFSARGAGILGFSMFSRERVFALNEEMEVDVELLQNFMDEHADETILMFGFTFMVWKHFLKELESSGSTLNFSNAILIHGGGWKKLQNEAVSKESFRECFKNVLEISRVHDYYGMVEQTGSIFMECEQGYLHASIFSEILIRRYADFTVADLGETGIIQVLSILPESYPGHSLLTEDEGMVVGEDNCPCGRLGKYFLVTGRIKSAELRGCSDTFSMDSATLGASS
jgi:phenylacetate-coenzyme A ligase PaaK-like adenylate-forming protein